MSRSLFCALALSLLSVSFAWAGDSTPERSFGVAPQLSPTRLAEQWQPLLNLLEARTGVHFHFVTASTISEFEENVLAGKYDYAYMNAAVCQEVQRAGSYHLLARRAPDMHGIVVVRRDGPKSITEMRNQVIAYPAPFAYGATLLNRNHLKKLHIDHRVAYLGSHESVYRAVAQGQFIAGGGVERTYNLLSTGLRQQLRILYRTPAAPSHAIAASSRIDPREAGRVRTALLILDQSVEGRKLLASLDMTRFRPDMPKDKARLRALGVIRHTRPRTIDFLVIPRLSHNDTLRQMEPLAAYFKQRLEIGVALRTFDNMESFERAIYTERGPALINANPLQAVRLARKGYAIFAQQVPVNSPRGMYSVILVRADSPIRSLADLRGKRVAFGGGPNAFFASIVPRVMLQRAGLHRAYIDASKPGPVSAVIKRLHDGDIDAAGTGAMALASEGLKDRYGIDRMRVIARGEPMPGLAWLVSPEVGPELRSEIRHLLLGYNPKDPGHSAMTAAGISGLSPASRKDYALVDRYLRELKRP